MGGRPSGWTEQNRPDRLPASYHRTHGVRCFHGCYSVGDDTLWVVNRRRRGVANTLAALKSIRAARPCGAPIYVILDNLSAHKGADIRRWAGKNKVELRFTPTYASWANPTGAHFGLLRQFTIANSHHPNPTIQTRALHAYLRWRNANAHHRDVLAAERKERARIRSEKGIRWGGPPLKRSCTVKSAPSGWPSRTAHLPRTRRSPCSAAASRPCLQGGPCRPRPGTPCPPSS